MAIIRWHPWDSFEELSDRLSRVANQSDFAVDMFDDDKDAIVVYVSAPGIDPEKIDVHVQENTLRLSGTRNEKEEHKGKNYYHREIRRGTFERLLTLPHAVAADRATAKAEHGILKIILPKLVGKKSSRITVSR